jgi:hypothetical protein
LQDLLLTIFFSHAILYNFNEGEIIIDLFENQVRMANAGKSPISDCDHVFERFCKVKESGFTGLGPCHIKTDLQTVISFDFLNLTK